MSKLKAFAAVITLFFVMPAWYILLYQIISRLDMPGWVWGIYFAYVPAGLMVAAFDKLGGFDE